MPFPDAKYPTATRTLPCGGPWAAHVVQLSNGERLYIEERDERVDIAVCEPRSDFPDLWVCAITRSGVLAQSYSGDACERIAAEPRHA